MRPGFIGHDRGERRGREGVAEGSRGSLGPGSSRPYSRPWLGGGTATSRWGWNLRPCAPPPAVAVREGARPWGRHY